MNTPHNLRNELKHDLDVLTGFWLHLLIYFATMVIMWFAWVVVGGLLDGNAWPIIPSIGWGLIVIVHCLVVGYRGSKTRKVDGRKP